MRNNKIVSLKSSKDFHKFITIKKWLSNKSFSLKFIKNNVKQLRYGLVVTKKLFKTAVSRNKIKRQLRMMLNSLELIKYYDVLIMVRFEYLTRTFKDNQKLFIDLYNKIDSNEH